LTSSQFLNCISATKKLLPLFRGRSYSAVPLCLPDSKSGISSLLVLAYPNTITGVTAGVYSFSIQYSRMHFSKFNLKSLSAYEDFSL
jgi:hypothetical protein